MENSNGDLVIQFNDASGTPDAGGQLILTNYTGNTANDISNLTDISVSVDVS